MNDLEQELEQARDEIDDIINEVGKAIIEIACGKTDEAADILNSVMENHAREEDAQETYEQYIYISGRRPGEPEAPDEAGKQAVSEVDARLKKYGIDILNKDGSMRPLTDICKDLNILLADLSKPAGEGSE